VLIYADPPYLMSTRTAADRHRYRHDYDEPDHRALIARLRELPAAVIISGYPSALYDELLGDWRTHAFQAMTRGGVRTEQLWMNYRQAGRPLGELRRQGFHRPAADQAQGGELGRPLSSDAAGGAPGRARRADGRGSFNLRSWSHDCSS
jgi:hypothetical protein